ncbi:hypothetical protein BJ322DRAFT_1017299 [Thelephora terrestris]|uniref:Uncharacterized protein n=1 Tax=Thelephora terrestris TaxID=56493 RepID=A0A9P6L8N1_9AGAM|nr:hypothetical protein BJ322DRAFT_1019793 [Thelephora terrestris]KAF9790627.1 hypothetical protein BJ322DRAFT_1017299 [Thelephora terrestris]
MAGTRAKNKDTHPAAPVMTTAAKIRAGIPTTKRQKKATKDDKIRALEARLAAFEQPDDAVAISQDPLFTRDSSPEDVDHLVIGSEAPTEADNEEFILVGGKRVPLSSYNPRALKRTKGFSSFHDVRPTVRNKPSGLISNWPQALTKTSMPLSRSSTPTLSTPSSSSQLPSPSPLVNPWHAPMLAMSSSSSSSQLPSPSPLANSWHAPMLTMSSSSSSPQVPPSPLTTPWQQDVFPIMSNMGPMIPVSDAATPFIGQPPFPFQFNTQNHQAANNLQQFQQAIPQPQQAVYSMPRRFRDEAGNLQTPGLKDLPFDLKLEFRNIFIRHIMKIVFYDKLPWSNPLCPVYQKEFSIIYPDLPFQIHPDDAVVLPVKYPELSSFSIFSHFLTSQTNRELGVLRNQIGSDALAAVIKYLPTQYNKRMLDSKAARGAYVQTLLDSSQKPFIWEYFRPGTIEIPRGEENYYDEKRRGPFQSPPVLRAFWTYFTSAGIHMRLPSEDAGRPVGALAMAAAAVERGYFLHRSGDLTSFTAEFSTTNWIKATNMYLAKIKNLTDDNWNGIFEGLYQVQEARAHEFQNEVGAVVEEEYEPLLSDDPPTPPPV